MNNGRLPEDIVVISTLNISDLQLHDVANYTCNASNSLVELRFAIADEAALTVLCELVARICIHVLLTFIFSRSS